MVLDIVVLYYWLFFHFVHLVQFRLKKLTHIVQFVDALFLKLVQKTVFSLWLFTHAAYGVLVFFSITVWWVILTLILIRFDCQINILLCELHGNVPRWQLSSGLDSLKSLDILLSTWSLFVTFQLEFRLQIVQNDQALFNIRSLRQSSDEILLLFVTVSNHLFLEDFMMRHCKLTRLKTSSLDDGQLWLQTCSGLGYLHRWKYCFTSASSSIDVASTHHLWPKLFQLILRFWEVHFNFLQMFIECDWWLQRLLVFWKLLTLQLQKSILRYMWFWGFNWFLLALC